VPGDMQLSPRMEARLSERFEHGVGGIDIKPSKVNWGGDWWCPGCGSRVVEHEPGELRCPKCHRALHDLAWELIEIHFHRK
jgi:hypothetical protein